MFLAVGHVSYHLRGAHGQFEGTGLGLRAPDLGREFMQAGFGLDLVAQDELGAWCQAAFSIPMSGGFGGIGGCCCGGYTPT
jgi:hypothetical protein